MTARRNPLLTELRHGCRRAWRRAREKRPGRGRSSASIPLAREEARPQVLFAGFTSGEVVVDPPSKKVPVRAIREAKLHSLITQDPDGHHAMLLILEGVALAARE